MKYILIVLLSFGVCLSGYGTSNKDYKDGLLETTELDPSISFFPLYMNLLFSSQERVTSPTHPLNDTGITSGGNYPNGNNSGCTGEFIVQQDCSQGRDVTHNDDSDGAAGFSFTKISAIGVELPAVMNSWSCVQDNVTGLMWEKKTDDDTVHNKEYRFRWGGLTAQGRDAPVREGDYYDSWNSLVNHANNNSLCGYSDWRVPTIEELLSITHLGSRPAIDVVYFPNTKFSVYWSSSPGIPSNNYALNVVFSDGGDGSSRRNNIHYIRLVR